MAVLQNVEVQLGRGVAFCRRGAPCDPPLLPGGRAGKTHHRSPATEKEAEGADLQVVSSRGMASPLVSLRQGLADLCFSATAGLWIRSSW